MRMIGFVCLIFSVITMINGQQGPMFFLQQQQRTLPVSFRTGPPFFSQSPARIPFPQCLDSSTASSILSPTNIQNLFQIKLQEEEKKLKQERVRNDNLNNSRSSIHTIRKWTIVSL